MSAGSESLGTSNAALFLAYFFPPENLSGAERPARFVKYLPGCDVQPVVICGGDGSRSQFASSSEHVIRTPGRVRRESASTRYLARLASVFQQTCLPYQEHLPWVPYAVAAGLRVAASTKTLSAIYSTSPPVATHLAAYFLKKRTGLRWIADFRDPLANNPFRTKRRARIYDPLLQRLIIRNADVVIGNTEHVVRSWAGMYPEMRHKFTVIWNGFDPGQEVPTKDLGSNRPYLLTHAGALYGFRHPGRLLASIRRLSEQGTVQPSEFHIRLIGSLDKATHEQFATDFMALEAAGLASANGVHVSKQEAEQALLESTGLLLLDLNETGTGLQVPAKIFEYIRTGKPIMAWTSRNSAVEFILSRSGVRHTMFYPDDSDAEVDRKVSAFLTLPLTPAPPNEWFSTNFDGRRQTEHLAQLLLASA